MGEYEKYDVIERISRKYLRGMMPELPKDVEPAADFPLNNMVTTQSFGSAVFAKKIYLVLLEYVA